MINMAYVRDRLLPGVSYYSLGESLTVDWVGDRILLDGEPFITREQVENGEHERGYMRKMARSYSLRRALASDKPLDGYAR